MGVNRQPKPLVSDCQTLNAVRRRAVMDSWHVFRPGHFSEIRASGLPIDIEFPVSPGCDNGPLFAGIISLELWIIWQQVSSGDSSSKAHTQLAVESQQARSCILDLGRRRKTRR